jgi:NAD(P)-dependent dehydrogenase (short-subunit alcohol dehydrogenase family)
MGLLFWIAIIVIPLWAYFAYQFLSTGRLAPLLSPSFKIGDLPALNGKLCIVTGATSGIGRVTAVALAAKGANVIATSRKSHSRGKGLEIANDMQKEVGDMASTLGSSPGDLVFMPLNLASLSSVKSFGHEFAVAYNSSLDILVLNAGVMHTDFGLTEDGFEMQRGTNHIGHFFLTKLLMDNLMQAPQARVVAVSSLAHMMGTPDIGTHTDVP